MPAACLVAGVIEQKIVQPRGTSTGCDWYRGCCSAGHGCHRLRRRRRFSAGQRSVHHPHGERDDSEVPRWLPIVQTARVLVRGDEGRPTRVAFTRKLERGSLGYTLEYAYDASTLTATWTTPASSNVVM